jgi:hypothetical protein
MRIGSTLAIGAMAAVLLATAAPRGHAATVDGVGSLELTAGYFQTAGNLLVQAEHARSDAARADRRRTDDDAADTPGIGSPRGNTIGYAAGGILTLGVVAAFVFGHDNSSDFIAADPPSGPGSGNDTPDSIGDPVNPPADPGTPDTPGGAQPDLPAGPTTVTPEPDVMILLATGLSSLGAVSIRRRRRTPR